jgi:hypothetical protein
LRDGTARLGGNWLSLVTVNLGSALIWMSIFVVAYRAQFHAVAYLFLGLSLAAAAWESGALALAALRRAERAAAQGEAAHAGESMPVAGRHEPAHTGIALPATTLAGNDSVR